MRGRAAAPPRGNDRAGRTLGAPVPTGRRLRAGWPGERPLNAAVVRTLVVLVLLACSGRPAAQLRPQPIGEHPGEAALQLALRRLASTGTFMHTTAHPDDEDNGLLAMLGHGRGMRTVLVSATRGAGGQNEIGPELFHALGVLRTEELHAVHRFDGAEQLFTRAVDFGYSFSVEETLEAWGRDAIVGDLVHHIRTVRPDVIAGFLCGGTIGGQHHQASALLTAEAFRAAADPQRYPEQIAAGLRPWQARRVFCTELSSFGPGGAAAPDTDPPHLRVDTSLFDPVLGRTYAEIGLEARSMHKCQGTSQLLLLPGESHTRTYRLMDAIDGSAAAPDSLFAGIDTTLPGLTRFAPAAAADLRPRLEAVASFVAAAGRHAGSRGAHAAVQPLADGLLAVRDLRRRIPQMTLAPDAAYEIDTRLALKEAQFQEALLVAAGARLEALGSDGLVHRGQVVPVSARVSSASAGSLEVRRVSFASADTAAGSPCAGTVRQGTALTCEAVIRVAEDAAWSTPYWHPRRDVARYDFAEGVPFGVPFAPTPFTATFELQLAGAAVTVTRPLEFRYGDIVAGEKRMELQVVPAFSVTLTPPIAIVASGSPSARHVEVTVTHHGRGAAAAALTLEVPDGWTTQPASVPLRFGREDERVSATFEVRPPARVRAGEHVVQASVTGGDGAASRVGYQVIEYPHTRRRHLVEPAEARLRVMDVDVAPGLTVGYITGVGDQVAEAIAQLGVRVHEIGPRELASGDLSRYDAIVTGVRAYERRADLRAHNHRLLAYAEAGGTVLVQYNKFEFNEAQYGPYRAKVGTGRVTSEGAPIEVLVPDHPVFTTPNRLDASTWEGWVQERGLYFLGERDPRYVDLVRLEDPFPFNRGPKTGALVEARTGQGRWIYIGLGLWRQLPAGVDGAYRLMANLLSLGASR